MSYSSLIVSFLCAHTHPYPHFSQTIGASKPRLQKSGVQSKWWEKSGTLFLHHLFTTGALRVRIPGSYRRHRRLFVKRRWKQAAIYCCCFWSVSLPLKKVFQSSSPVVYSFVAASAGWRRSLFKLFGALRSFSGFESLCLYFWRIQSFASSCSGCVIACCMLNFLRLTTKLRRSCNWSKFRRCDESRILCAHVLHGAVVNGCQFVHWFNF